MVVSKIAVVALVAVIAVPILLGYAFNLSEETVTEYKLTDNSVNVSLLLENDQIYGTVHGNSYQMNTQAMNGDASSLPYYNSVSSNVSSMPIVRTMYYHQHPSWGGSSGIALSTWNYLFYQSFQEGGGGYVIGNYCNPDGTLIQQITHLRTVHYDPKLMTIEYSYMNGGVLYSGIINVPATNYRFGLTDSGGYDGNGYAEYLQTSNPGTYADFSKGFHFIGEPVWSIGIPQNTKKVLWTMDLDSLPSFPNYSIDFSVGYDEYTIEKTTTAGVISWRLDQKDSGVVVDSLDLYYNDRISHNTYQFYTIIEDLEYDGTYYNYKQTLEARYVGEWPTVIGKANVYQTYTFEKELSLSNPSYTLDRVSFTNASVERSPDIRVDDCEYYGLQFSVMKDVSFAPHHFKDNPSTKITNTTLFGTSISFGGNTYNVTNGNITLGTHQYSVNGLILDSVPNQNGGYDNRINGYVISTTAKPSWVTFNGSWSASVAVTAQEVSSYNHTEWTAGHFGWDGIDQNFLLVGLITCLGVFIGLGIYARRSARGGIIPLMIVTGCAAAVFFIML